MKAIVKIFAKGFGIGVADIIPGVSGGTMALIFGIYPRLIKAINSFDKVWLYGIVRLDYNTVIHRPHLQFLAPLLLGMIMAVLFFTRVISLPTIIYTHAEIIYGLFFGLILGAVPILLWEIGGVLQRGFPFILLGSVAGYYVFNMIPVTTPNTGEFIFLSGMIAVSAMILPGLSGSFVLLILKKYAFIFNAIGQFNFAVILPFMFGMIVGLVLFSRILAWAMAAYYQEILSLIVGLLIASLWIIWPFQERVYESVLGSEKLIASTPFIPDQFNADIVFSLVMMAVGFSLALALKGFSTPKSGEAEQYGRG